MSNTTKYATKQHANTLTVLPPATSSSLPPRGQQIDLNVFKCVVTADTAPTNGAFAPGTVLTVHNMALWAGVGGPPGGWSMGFQASSQHPVQVDQVND